MRRNQRGAVLLAVLLVVAATVTTAASLVTLSVTERMLAAVEREATELRYASEAVAAFTLTELASVPDWTPILSGAGVSTFSVGGSTAVVGGSRTVDLAARSGLFGPIEPGAWGGNQPTWRLYAWGPAAAFAPTLSATSIQVAAWVADDERDGDLDSSRDSNGRVLLRGEAFGPVHGQRAIVVVARREAPAPSPLRVLDWRFPGG